MAHLEIAPAGHRELSEADLVQRARDGEGAAFRTLMQRCNKRLFRVARAVVRDDSEAEDIVQEAYLRAFSNLSAFRSEASILTWLTRIVLNEANGRLRRRRHHVALDVIERIQTAGRAIIFFPGSEHEADPEQHVARMDARRVLERAIDELPADFRLVFMMRDVEDCTVAETAAALGIREETVKTRLHRARRRLRAVLTERLAPTIGDAFLFLGARCERICVRVLSRLECAPAEGDAAITAQGTHQ